MGVTGKEIGVGVAVGKGGEVGMGIGVSEGSGRSVSVGCGGISVAVGTWVLVGTAVSGRARVAVGALVAVLVGGIGVALTACGTYKRCPI